MKILVVGATGRTGRPLVHHAVRSGHDVRAFARSAGDVDWPEGAEGMAGDALSPTGMDRAMQGMDAVVVALSMVRASDSPWAPILTPRDLHSRAAALLTSAARAHGVSRYLTVSAHGAGPSASRAGWAFLTLVRSSNIGVAYANLAEAEEVVRASNLDWTIVRPTRLTGGSRTGRWEASPTLTTSSFDRIRRSDLAAFLVGETGLREHVHEAVSVTGR